MFYTNDFDFTFAGSLLEDIRETLAKVLNSKWALNFANNLQPNYLHRLGTGCEHIRAEDILQETYLTLSADSTLLRLSDNAKTSHNANQLAEYMLQAIRSTWRNPQRRACRGFVDGMLVTTSLLEHAVDQETLLPTNGLHRIISQRRETAEQEEILRKLSIAEKVIAAENSKSSAGLIELLTTEKNKIKQQREAAIINDGEPTIADNADSEQFVSLSALLRTITESTGLSVDALKSALTRMKKPFLQECTKPRITFERQETPQAKDVVRKPLVDKFPDHLL